MSKPMIRREVDLNHLPPLTQAQAVRLKALAARPDSGIDLSDIPPLTDEFFKNGMRNPFLKPIKTSTTVRLDTDVLAWLRRSGKGYQTRINAILREAMLRAIDGVAAEADGKPIAKRRSPVRAVA